MKAVETQKETPTLELSADQLRQTIEALLRMESELPTDVAEENEGNACS